MTGAWYAMIYGTATYYRAPALRAAGRRRAPRPARRSRVAEAAYRSALDASLGYGGRAS